jgi:protein TonB
MIGTMGNPNRRWDWLQAALLACGLNLVLFLIMPALIASQPDKPAFETVVPQVSLTRLRPPEPTKPPEPVKPPEPKPLDRPTPTPTALPTPKLSLPFEINPRLPSSPTTLELPPVDTSLPQASTSDLFSVGQLDGPLTTLVQIPPIYPHTAKRRNIEGWVKVKFVVDEQGTVGQVKVLAAEPEGVFEQSVLRCVAGWRFKPGTIGGVAVKALVEQTITFKLE